MLSFPNCKINIGLNVVRKRNDGYHDIETIFYPIDLCDALEIVPSRETNIYISGLEVPGNGTDNLVWKAYELMRNLRPGEIPAFDIYLHKVIPMGAGLGGGSANGAFMLRLINDLCRLGLDDPRLADLALQLGSDCPFFIYNTPKIAKGRGEQMSDVRLDLAIYSIQIVCPKVHISTGKAFQMLTPKPAAFDLDKIEDLPITDWKNLVVNDFEHAVFGLYPQLHLIKQQLYDQGALYASMSGSGSSLFGIFPKNQKAIVDSTIAFDTFYIG